MKKLLKLGKLLDLFNLVKFDKIGKIVIISVRVLQNYKI